MDQREYSIAGVKVISATEAREKATKNISDKCKEELQAAMKCIHNAVNSGENECWCYTYLNNQCLRELKNKLGYSVENCSDQREGTMFKIKW